MLKDKEREGQRLTFEYPLPAHVMAIDGTWRRSCVLKNVSETDATLQVDGKRDFPRTLTPAVLMDCPSIGRYRAVQAVAALWKLMGSRSVISASPAR